MHTEKYGLRFTLTTKGNICSRICLCRPLQCVRIMILSFTLHSILLKVWDRGFCIPLHFSLTPPLAKRTDLSLGEMARICHYVFTFLFEREYRVKRLIMWPALLLFLGESTGIFFHHLLFLCFHTDTYLGRPCFCGKDTDNLGWLDSIWGK